MESSDNHQESGKKQANKRILKNRTVKYRLLHNLIQLRKVIFDDFSETRDKFSTYMLEENKYAYGYLQECLQIHNEQLERGIR